MGKPHPILDEPLELISEVEKASKGLVTARASWQEAEKMVHATAFEYYYKLGDNRSLAKVAAYMKVTQETITRWSGRFKWQARIKERDQLVRQDDRAHNSLQIMEVKKAVADYLGAELQATVKKMEDGTLKVQGPKIKTLKDVNAALDAYYRVTGEQQLEDAAKRGRDNANPVNIQFVVKGR